MTESALFAAIRRAQPSVSTSLATFDELAHGAADAPDFFEWSARVDGTLSPSRLTYYFDVGRRGPATAALAGERFLSIARALGISLPPKLERIVRSDLPARPEVLQVVLGIDDRDDPAARRLKYYLVFRAEPGALLAELLEAADVPRPAANVELARTYIVGLDFGRSALEDAKLYFRLDLSRLGSIVASSAEIAPVVRGSRELVLQQCLKRPGRRQLYFHATNENVLRPWLQREGERRPEVRELLGLADRIGDALGPGRLAPWIASLAYQDRRLDPSAMNLYFHVSDG